MSLIARFSRLPIKINKFSYDCPWTVFLCKFFWITGLFAVEKHSRSLNLSNTKRPSFQYNAPYYRELLSGLAVNLIQIKYIFHSKANGRLLKQFGIHLHCSYKKLCMNGNLHNIILSRIYLVYFARKKIWYIIFCRKNSTHLLMIQCEENL